jgi:hypothetical protein
MNSKLQGNVGIGAAIAHFTSLGWIVSIPLTDSQKYDLIVDDGTSLKRVSVKTTAHKPGRYFAVQLRTLGGNQSFHTVQHFDPTKAELLFVYCADQSRYVIPTAVITAKSTIMLGTKYATYRL